MSANYIHIAAFLTSFTLNLTLPNEVYAGPGSTNPREKKEIEIKLDDSRSIGLGFDSDSKPIYWILRPDGSKEQLSKKQVNSLMESVVDLVNTVCEWRIVPETVTVSVGVLTATWETKLVCRKQK